MKLRINLYLNTYLIRDHSFDCIASVQNGRAAGTLRQNSAKIINNLCIIYEETRMPPRGPPLVRSANASANGRPLGTFVHNRSKRRLQLGSST